jgi:hypothetical protein
MTEITREGCAGSRDEMVANVNSEGASTLVSALKNFSKNPLTLDTIELNV